MHIYSGVPKAFPLEIIRLHRKKTKIVEFINAALIRLPYSIFVLFMTAAALNIISEVGIIHTMTLT